MKRLNGKIRKLFGTSSILHRAVCVEAMESRTFLNAVTASTFALETAWSNSFTFQTDPASAFTLESLTVNNLFSQTEPVLDRAKLALTASGTTRQLTFPGYTFTAPPDGNYETLIEDEGLTGLPEGYSLDFFVYSADFNRDRTINISDFSTLAANFNTPQTYSGGDTTYDGTANIGDFSILANKFNMILNPPPASFNDLSLMGGCDTDGNPIINLMWSQPNPQPPEQPPRQGFHIWRSTDGVNFGGVYDTVGPDTFTYADDEVVEGTRYWYRVRAFSASGNSETTPKRDMKTALRCPTNLALEQTNTAQFHLTWVNTSQLATEVLIYRYTTDILQSTFVGSVPVTQPQEITDTIPQPGVRWFYYAQANNPTQTSAPSNIVTTPASPPEGLTATLALSPMRIDLDWANNPEAGVVYNLYRSTDENFSPDATTLYQSNLTSSYFPDQSVSSSVRYFYGVTAAFAQQGRGEELTQQGESACINYATTITQTDAQPTDLLVSLADESTIDVYWSDQSGNETGYNVYHRGGQYFDWTLAATLPPDATFFTDRGLAQDTEYEFKIDALHAQPTAPPPASQPVTTRFASEYRGLIQIFLGLGQQPTSNHGMVRLAREFRAISEFTAGGELRYRVKVYTSTDDHIHDDGSGRAAIDFTDGWLNQGVEDFAILGYSWGGGATYALSNWESVVTAPGGITANLRFTAYVDAVQLRHKLGAAESRKPVNTMWHSNYYETSLVPPHGVSIPTSNIDRRVTAADNNGNSVVHANIDDIAFTHDQLTATLRNRMPLNDIS